MVPKCRLVITDDKGKEHVIVDKALAAGKRNLKGNTTFITTGFGIPTPVSIGGDVLFLGLTLQTRKSGGGATSLVD